MDPLDVVAVDLEWVAVAVDTLPRCSMLTAVTSLQALLSTLFVLDLLADAHVVGVVMVEELVVSMVVPLLFSVVDWEPSVCRAVHMQHKDAPSLATLV